MNNNKVLLSNILNKYNYFIYEITILDKIKNIYIGNKDTNKVEKCVCGTSYRDILADVAYNLAMYGKV